MKSLSLHHWRRLPPQRLPVGAAATVTVAAKVTVDTSAAATAPVAAEAAEDTSATVTVLVAAGATIQGVYDRDGYRDGTDIDDRACGCYSGDQGSPYAVATAVTAWVVVTASATATSAVVAPSKHTPGRTAA